jgi:hypothetical protein
MMSSFDPMAAAIDWLDAYRVGALSIDDLYVDDASIFCGCGGEKAVSGPEPRKAYWVSRFANKPAGDLIGIEDRGGDVVAVTYRTSCDVVQSVLVFDGSSGLVTLQRCGPL